MIVSLSTACVLYCIFHLEPFYYTLAMFWQTSSFVLNLDLFIYSGIVSITGGFSEIHNSFISGKTPS